VPLKIAAVGEFEGDTFIRPAPLQRSAGRRREREVPIKGFSIDALRKRTPTLFVFQIRPMISLLACLHECRRAGDRPSATRDVHPREGKQKKKSPSESAGPRGATTIGRQASPSIAWEREEVLRS